jgi:exosome complex component RRP45
MKKYASNALLSSNERNFVVDALKEQLRIDGRRYYDVRNIKISYGPALGLAEVQLGVTRLVE